MIIKQKVQIVVFKTPYSFIKYAIYANYIKTLILSDEILILWITINFSDLQNMLLLILASIWYKNNDINNSLEVFATMTTIMNLVIIAYFFEAIYYNIFKYILAASSKDERFFSPISTYFSIIEKNG